VNPEQFGWTDFFPRQNASRRSFRNQGGVRDRIRARLPVKMTITNPAALMMGHYFTFTVRCPW